MKILLVTLLTLFIATTCFAKSVTLSWDPSPTERVIGYSIYYSVNADISDPTIINAGDVLTYKIESLDNSTVFYFTVTAYDAENNESAFSNIVDTGMCIDPPPNLGIGGISCTNIIINVGK